MESICGNCSKEGAVFACAGCQHPHCTFSCQAKDWAHSPLCKQMQKLNSADQLSEANVLMKLQKLNFQFNQIQVQLAMHQQCLLTLLQDLMLQQVPGSEPLSGEHASVPPPMVSAAQQLNMRSSRAQLQHDASVRSLSSHESQSAQEDLMVEPNEPFKEEINNNAQTNDGDGCGSGAAPNKNAHITNKQEQVVNVQEQEAGNGQEQAPKFNDQQQQKTRFQQDNQKQANQFDEQKQHNFQQSARNEQQQSARNEQQQNARRNDRNEQQQPVRNEQHQNARRSDHNEQQQSARNEQQQNAYRNDRNEQQYTRNEDQQCARNGQQQHTRIQSSQPISHTIMQTGSGNLTREIEQKSNNIEEEQQRNARRNDRNEQQQRYTRNDRNEQQQQSRSGQQQQSRSGQQQHIRNEKEQYTRNGQQNTRTEQQHTRKEQEHNTRNGQQQNTRTQSSQPLSHTINLQSIKSKPLQKGPGNTTPEIEQKSTNVEEDLSAAAQMQRMRDDIAKHNSIVEAEAAAKRVLVPPFKHEMFEVGDTNVEASVVDLSVANLGIIGLVEAKHVSIVGQLQLDLQNLRDAEPYQPIADEYCLAFYGTHLYRAKCLDVLDDGTYMIVYIDFGNEGVVDSNMIRRYPKDLNVPCRTAQCVVKGIANDLNEEQASYLVKWLDDFPLLIIDKVLEVRNEMAVIECKMILNELRNSEIL